MSLDVDELFDGRSLEFPLVLEDDAARAGHSIQATESGGGPPEYEDDDLDHDASRNGGRIVHPEDREMAADMCALSIKNTGGVYNSERLSAGAEQSSP